MAPACMCDVQRLFMTNFRPVPLTEHAVFGGKVFRKRGLPELRALRQAAADKRAEQVAVAVTVLWDCRCYDSDHAWCHGMQVDQCG